MKVKRVALTFTDWLIISGQSKHPLDALNVLKVVLDALTGVAQVYDPVIETSRWSQS